MEVVAFEGRVNSRLWSKLCRNFFNNSIVIGVLNFSRINALRQQHLQNANHITFNDYINTRTKNLLYMLEDIRALMQRPVQKKPEMEKITGTIYPMEQQLFFVPEAYVEGGKTTALSKLKNSWKEN